MVVTIYEDEMTEAGSYHVESEWADAYRDGEMTEEEMLAEIMMTVEA